jgi:hypothetical protein
MVAGAPDNMVEYYVRQAIIDMAYKTLNIQRDYYIDTQCNVCDYELPLEDGFYPHMIRSVELDGRELIGVQHPPARGEMFHGNFYYEQPNRLLVGSVPSSDCDEGLLVRTVVVPSQKTCSVDRWIYDRYLNDIVTGALSHLFLMAGASWYSTTNGGIYLRRWKGMLANMKTERHKGNIAGPTFMKTRRVV